MEPWDKHLNNLSTEEVQQLDRDYGGWFVGDIKDSTPLQDFAIKQIVHYLFHSSHSDTDVIPRNDEDLQYALSRPARIFQLGMEREPVDVVGILKCIEYWADEHCKNCEYGGIRPFLSEIFNEHMESPQSGEEYEEMAMILFAPDLSAPPPVSWNWPR